MAKGARRPKQNLEGVLAPPQQIQLDISYRVGRDLQTLTSAEFERRFTAFSTDLIRSAAALLAVEMLDRAVRDSDPHPLLYRLITATLGALDDGEIAPPILLDFYQLHLANQLGFAPHLEYCVNCGNDLKDAVLDNLNGDLTCLKCGNGGTSQLDREALSYLLWLRSTHITNLTGPSWDAKARLTAGRFLRDFLYLHVDDMSKLRAMKFWDQVQK
jgi:DNA repair protein RecO (recombination protein O)